MTKKLDGQGEERPIRLIYIPADLLQDARTVTLEHNSESPADEHGNVRIIPNFRKYWGSNSVSFRVDPIQDNIMTRITLGESLNLGDQKAATFVLYWIDPSINDRYGPAFDNIVNGQHENLSRKVTAQSLIPADNSAFQPRRTPIPTQWTHPRSLRRRLPGYPVIEDPIRPEAGASRLAGAHELEASCGWREEPGARHAHGRSSNTREDRDVERGDVKASRSTSCRRARHQLRGHAWYISSVPRLRPCCHSTKRCATRNDNVLYPFAPVLANINYSS